MDTKREQIAAIFHQLSPEGQELVKSKAETILRAESALKGQREGLPDPERGKRYEGIPGAQLV